MDLTGWKKSISTLFKGLEEEEVECESIISYLTKKGLLDLCKVVFELGKSTTLLVRTKSKGTYICNIGS